MYPESLAHLLENVTGSSPFADAAEIAPCQGAYVLSILLAESVTPALRSLPETRLAAGIYVYAGSANGPGGIRARIGRHLRRNKKIHWHVDRLTIAAASVTAHAVPGGSECDLVDRLLATDAFETPLPGFGSSDCRRCASHLLRLREV